MPAGMTALEEINAQIAIREEELAVLKRARDILIASAGDLATASAREAALAVLSESDGEPIHFREIAKLAHTRGYRGRAGTPEKNAVDTFRSSLNRIPEIVEQVGDGMYRLRKKP